MAITEIELKILYKVNEFKEGVLLSELSKQLDMNRGNMSRYVNTLILKGVIDEISKNPKIVRIAKIKELFKLNIVKCLKCKLIRIMPNTIHYFYCNCGVLVNVNKDTKIGDIKEESYGKLAGICYKYKLKSLDDAIELLVKDRV